MADVEPVVQTGQQVAVTQPNTQAESAPASTQEAVSNPPAGESPAENQPEKGPIPYPRFQEVVQQRNEETRKREEWENRFRQMESRVVGAPNTSRSDALVQRMVAKLGISEDAAKELVAIQREAAREERQGIDSRMHQYEINEWHRINESKYKDYRQMFPEMEKAFAALDPNAQALVVSSPKALEMLYKQAKAENYEKKMQESFNAGANQAYQNKANKQAGAFLPGQSQAAQNTKLTREGIAAMSVDEYRKRLPEINEALSKGLLK